MVQDAILAHRLLDRQQIAARVAQDLDDDWVVNVGIGMPTLVPAYVAAQRGVIKSLAWARRPKTRKTWIRICSTPARSR